MFHDRSFYSSSTGNATVKNEIAFTQFGEAFCLTDEKEYLLFTFKPQPI